MVERSVMRAVAIFLSIFFVTASGFAAGVKATGKPAPDQLLYLATWPHTIRVVDIGKEKVVDQIELPTDIARILVLSPDRTKLYASTLRDNSIVTIDLKTRKVLGSFSVNEETETNRLSGLTIDPTGKYLYSVITTVTKKLDHYEIGEPKVAVIDLEAKKITRRGDFPKDEQPGARALLRVSPDGKSLYVFRQSILVINTSDFKLSKKIELSSPIAPPGMENLSLSVLDDPNEPPGKLMSIFNASDPYVHRDIFGIAEIDLTNQNFELTPVGPAATSIQPLMLNPDRSLGYTVAVNGTHGNRVTEFWVFDMKNKKLINKREFVGRTRLNLGMSADGKKLLIYNAGFEVEVYDAKTLALENTINLQGDTTSNIIVAPLN
jgi:DNA-binding beta-propeller fold protein YncE